MIYLLIFQGNITLFANSMSYCRTQTYSITLMCKIWMTEKTWFCAKNDFVKLININWFSCLFSLIKGRLNLSINTQQDEFMELFTYETVQLCLFLKSWQAGIVRGQKQ